MSRLALPLLNNAMRAAASEGRKRLGASSPNPAVGAAALNAQGEILALAAHQKAGEKHGEALLLDLCRARGLLEQVHTICVTLEPCNHHGRTPPCSEALIAAGIKHAAIGVRDPNPKAAGGIERLQQAGIDVVTRVEENICRQSLYPFLYSVENSAPFITVKRALTRDGSMIPPVGQTTFTASGSLRFAHRLRKKADAILTGSGTILADNPAFTVRHVPDYPGKQRFLGILDRRCRVPDSYLKQAQENGFIPLIYSDLAGAVADLGQRGAREILLEAGPGVTQSALDSGLWSMDVEIRQGSPDEISAKFNPQKKIPFAYENWEWENLLPNEEL